VGHTWEATSACSNTTNAYDGAVRGGGPHPGRIVSRADSEWAEERMSKGTKVESERRTHAGRVR
jgi:hypothetical protein